MSEEHAKKGLYIGLGISTAVIIACRAIEAGNDWLKGQEVRRRNLTRWANYWMKKPKDRGFQ